MYICFRIHHFDDEPAYTSLSPVALAAATTAGNGIHRSARRCSRHQSGQYEDESPLKLSMTTFGKIYLDPSENATRFTIFSENVMRVAAMNAADPHATFSVLTPWADMTPEEYSKMHGLVTSETSPRSDPGLPCQLLKKGKFRCSPQQLCHAAASIMLH